jgi:hypothetical protein
MELNNGVEESSTPFHSAVFGVLWSGHKRQTDVREE